MLESEPNDAFLIYAVAMEYRKTAPEKSLLMLEQLATTHPNYTATYYHLAAMYREAGRHQEAKETYEKGIAICQNMQDYHALSELQRAYQQWQNETEE
ncbi:MAG: tetratricopeptide repeat protein [Cytophagales bacterium]|nr:tetratricopeptide repeat protein [Bernardetiaceae bacterium]MDW8205800.1 tetratricopeptide repeat protein [Cytophagales bacterium]